MTWEYLVRLRKRAFILPILNQIEYGVASRARDVDQIKEYRPMSMAKQLLLLLSALFLAIFLLNYVTSVNNIRSYLEFESGIHAQDTANSLGLSLSHYIVDNTDPMLDTMINSVFDSGYYQEVILADPLGKELIRKTNPTTYDVVPAWFTRLLPMKTATATSEISSGWRNGGTLSVAINPGIGYLKLWEQAKQALYYSVASFVVALGALYIVLALVLRSLARIDRFALDVADGRYEILQPLPWTTEVRNVATSMNLMSAKIKLVIGSLNTRLDQLTHNLRADELTGLDIRATFDTDMKEKFMSRGHGFVFVIHLNELGQFANSRGDEVTDRLLCEFAECLRKVADSTQTATLTVYRFRGAEFAVLAENLERDAVQSFCEALVAAFTKLAAEFDKPNVAQFGGAWFDSLSTVAGTVSSASAANDKARLIGPNSFSLAEDSEKSRSQDEWRTLVMQVVDAARFDIEMIARAHRLSADAADEVVLEEVFTKVYDEEGEVIPIGTFVSVAQACAKIVELDSAMMRKAIQYLRENVATHGIAINISLESMADLDFRKHIFDLFHEYPEQAPRIVFCVTAYTASKNIEAFRSFIVFVHRIGAKILLKRFEVRFMPLEQIKELDIDFIRLALIYTEQVGTDARKRQVVEAMQELANVVGIQLIAEAVHDDVDHAALRDIGLYAASR
jgi:EAL domain-containing protein (putative c-di-GMP-specific phosphodiesterase class I)/GGDEF domain-containing protein